MAAPFFCSAAILTADLQKLGYPEIDDPQLLTTEGDSRVSLLTWLAEQVDPTVQFNTAHDAAKFWQTLGIHSGEPDSAGYITPFTAPNRPRDRAAAFVFLRAAVDLVLAVRRQREGNPFPIWLNSDLYNDADTLTEINRTNEIENHSHCTETVNEFDQQALAQMDTLIARRHKLFPSSTQLLMSTSTSRPKRLPLSTRSTTSTNISGGSSPSKRSGPIARADVTVGTRSNPKSGARHDTKSLGRSTSRVVSKTNAQLNAKSSPKLVTKRTASKVSVSISTSAPPRDFLLDRLRTLRREIADLSGSSETATNSRVDPEPKQNELSNESVEQCEALDEVALAENALAVTSLARQFNAVVDDACTIRSAKGRQIERDFDMENSISQTASYCLELSKSICSTLTMLSRARTAVGALQRGRDVLRALPDCIPVRRVLQQRLRTECHL